MCWLQTLRLAQQIKCFATFFEASVTESGGGAKSGKGLKQVAAGTDDELAKEVWDLTQEELDRGWVDAK